jgi:chemotaxis protein MotA
MRLAPCLLAPPAVMGCLFGTMLVFLGYVIVLASVFGGFALTGGHLGAMYQPTELLIIGGGAVGAFVVGNPFGTLKATARSLPLILKASKCDKALYLELMGLLYEVLNKARKDGLMALENDVEHPYDSPLFTRYPKVISSHRLMEFITDYLRLMVSSNLNSIEIEGLMEQEIETHHHEAQVPMHAIQRVGDGLPAFGIVAAVMGVVHTMQSVGVPPAELGRLIAHALVGTFLGILLSYGFVSPLAGRLEQNVDESMKLLDCIKVTLLASLNNYPPAIAIEFGRKVLYAVERPSFDELDAHLRQVRR